MGKKNKQGKQKVKLELNFTNDEKESKRQQEQRDIETKDFKKPMTPIEIKPSTYDESEYDRTKFVEKTKIWQEGVEEGYVPAGWQEEMKFEHDKSNDPFAFVNDYLSTDQTFENEDVLEKALTIAEEPDDAETLTRKLKELQVEKNIIVLGSNTGCKLSSDKNDHPYAIEVDITKPPEKFATLEPNMARKYPFKLDIWQQHAVCAMDVGDSVFIAAHTSAGKTCVAEYAVALSHKNNTRVIYTSPIKALSNQKYRDFYLQFTDVGLVTGDIQINQSGFCLVMTTEILRSMLYNGSPVVRELEWVIFDEVHYINDVSRGVVWEEVLIMLPSHVRIVMLSATAPNAIEFADWVGRIKNRRIHCIATSKRPVPLEHFLYSGQDGKSKDDRFLILKEGQFLARGWLAASQAMKEKRSVKNFRPSPKSDRNIYIMLIGHLQSKDLLPAIMFIFSRKRCDDYAAMLTSIDLTNESEKNHVKHFFAQCMQKLSEVDRQLPQVKQLEMLCTRGIAVHHSGILPLLKEMVEMLFASGFIKILFATETFAMGVNMPARTVVFDSIDKHDGIQKRDLRPGEYIQMAGRAGRRGLDTAGTVIILCKGLSPPESTSLTTILTGKPTKLASHFRVTYPMVLNVLRIETIRVEEVLQRSYTENESLKSTIARRQRLQQLADAIGTQSKIACATCDGDNALKRYHRHTMTYLLARDRLICSLLYNSKLFCAGRLVIVCIDRERPFQLAVILKVHTANPQHVKFDLFIPARNEDECKEIDEALRMNTASDDEFAMRIFDLHTNQMLHHAMYGEQMTPLREQYMTHIIAQNISYMHVTLVTQILLRIPNNLSTQSDAQDQLIADLSKYIDSWQNEPIPAVTLNDVSHCDLNTYELWNEFEKLRHCPSVACLDLNLHLEKLCDSERLVYEHRRMKFHLSDDALRLKPDFDGKLRVLRILEFVDDEDVLQLKGKVAASLHNAELLLTELLMLNVFGNLSPSEIAAVLSCTTCQYKCQDKMATDYNPELKVRMEELKSVVETYAGRMQQVQVKCHVLDAEDDILNEISFNLMTVVHEWARGVPFADIMKLTECQEGIIVRCIQRLDEVIHDMRNAAIIIGNMALRDKFEQVSVAIRRDIVFTASLYIDEKIS